MSYRPSRQLLCLVDGLIARSGPPLRQRATRSFPSVFASRVAGDLDARVKVQAVSTRTRCMVAPAPDLQDRIIEELEQARGNLETIEPGQLRVAFPDRVVSAGMAAVLARGLGPGRRASRPCEDP